MKKIVILLLALFLFIGAVHGEGFLDSVGITPFEAPTDINVSDFVFKIPSGFGEDGSARRIAYNSTIKGKNYSTWSADYVDDNGSIISIVVYKSDGSISLKSLADNESEQKTIHGKDGWFKEVGDSYYFAYVENGQAVRIYAPSEEILERLFV